MIPGFVWAFGRRGARMEQVARLMKKHHRKSRIGT